MGWCRACRVRTSASVVSVCTRRRGGSYGLLYVCCAGTGELPHRSTYVVGHENASVREGGGRQRRSQTPRCNDGDTVKVCQAWCTETASYTRTWGPFTMGRLLSDKRPPGFGRVTGKQSGLNPLRWKAECVERRPLRLEGGKDCKVLPILTFNCIGVERRYASNSNHWQNSVCISYTFIDRALADSPAPAPAAHGRHT